MALTLASKLTIPAHVLTRELDGELVILDLQHETYLGLDAVGTRIWQLLGEHQTVEAVYQQLLEEYDVQPEQLRSDLLELLEELQIKGLVEQVK